MSQVSKQLYDVVHAAYDHFNAALFEGRLPECVIVLHRKRGAHGYFWEKQWARRGENSADNRLPEIALNPLSLSRNPAEALSTLVHEMVHHEQHAFGKPSKTGHNKEWASWMDRVGLEPTSTGQPGGKRTGRKVSHMIVPGGEFAVACEAFLLQNPEALAVFAVENVVAPKEKKRDLSKVCKQCPQCDAKVWGKQGFKVICGDCDEIMVEEEFEEGEA